MTTPDSPEWDIPLHRPAMVEQVLEYLQPPAGGRALDVTTGTGGHSIALARRLGHRGLLVGMDRDMNALKVARKRLEEIDCPFRLFKGTFSRADEAAERVDVDGFDSVLADQGIGTHQMDDPERGFSYRSTARLDMRYDRSQRMTAWEVVNREPEDSLADIFWKLGEERLSRQIARAIVRRRDREPIDTPAELADLIEDVAARGGGEWHMHPATRVMMALRIYVNGEMEELEQFLGLLPNLLVPGGRAVLLTYHSLEARRVKKAWQAQQEEGRLTVLTDSPVTPDAEEINDNPRVRSCQLRAAARPRRRGGAE